MSEKPLVVLLGHQAHVGKDMLGLHLVESHNFQRFGFADKLKEVVADLYGFSTEQMYGELKNVVDERYGITPRQILQDFGQEQRERFPDIWADYVLRQIEDCFNPQDNTADFFNGFVVTDFRFPNEFTVAKRYAEKYDWSLKTVKIVRPDEQRGEFAGSTNISETALNDFKFDLELHNNQTPEILFDRFERLVLDVESGKAQTITIDLGFIEKTLRNT